MATAKIFQNGRSQAIRLPKEYRFDEDEVIIKKIGELLIVYPKKKEEEIFLSSLGNFTDDFFDAIETGRKNQMQAEREQL